MAKRPPSNGTKGRNSGGNTGRTFKIIHSGRLFELNSASITLRRFEYFFILVSEDVEFISSLKTLTCTFKSIAFNKS